MAYTIYLRKSQADLEAEAFGVGETLSRHRSTLLELAQRLQLPIQTIYEEIVSGETIAARPQMQKLLTEVCEGKWDGVLVMEVERLARGDSIDQGIVAQAFKFSGTKIITPSKIYDPRNEFDEEYLEFGLFMSRREYKTIKRRMVAGRIASVKEGKYMGKVDPYGYHRIKLEHEKGWSLEIVPSQAEIIRKIFAWYQQGESLRIIAQHLKNFHIKTQTGQDWSASGIRAILQNPLYCGYVTWGHKPTHSLVEEGRIIKKRYISKDYLKVRGLHEAIIPEDTWEKVQDKLHDTPGYPIRSDRVMRNPFQGLLYCAKCGHGMTLSTSTRNGKPNYGVMCPQPHCNTVSSRLPFLESAVLDALKSWIGSDPIPVENASALSREHTKDLQQMLTLSASEISRIDFQLTRAEELVEQNIYTPEQFAERRKILLSRKQELTETYTQTNNLYRSARTHDARAIPQTVSILDAYSSAATAEEKNKLLRSILQRIEYVKEPTQDGTHRTNELTLHFFPKIPYRENVSNPS